MVSAGCAEKSRCPSGILSLSGGIAENRWLPKRKPWSEDTTQKRCGKPAPGAGRKWGSLFRFGEDGASGSLRGENAHASTRAGEKRRNPLLSALFLLLPGRRGAEACMPSILCFARDLRGRPAASLIGRKPPAADAGAYHAPPGGRRLSFSRTARSLCATEENCGIFWCARLKDAGFSVRGEMQRRTCSAETPLSNPCFPAIARTGEKAAARRSAQHLRTRDPGGVAFGCRMPVLRAICTRRESGPASDLLTASKIFARLSGDLPEVGGDPRHLR